MNVRIFFFITSSFLLSFDTHSMLQMKKFQSMAAIPVNWGNQEEPEIHSPKSDGAQLLVSCKSGELGGQIGMMIVSDYLKRDPDLTVCDYHGSALMWAAAGGLTDVVDRLIRHGARLEVTSKCGYTALHAAAQEGHVATVEYLQTKVSHPLDITIRAACGSTALHLAAQEGHHAMVAYLLELGASVNCGDRMGRTALHLAAWKGHKDVCQLLIKAGAHKDEQAKFGITPLYAAIVGGSLPTVLLLLESGADVDVITHEGESIAECIWRTNHAALIAYFHSLSIPAKESAELAPIIEL